MRKYIWVVAGSLACGSVIAMLAGADSLPWLKFVPLGLISAGAAATILWNRYERRASAHQHPLALLPTLPSRAMLERERETMQYVESLLTERTMAWVSAERYEGAWRDQYVKPLRELIEYDINRGALANPHLEQGLADLAAAVRRFLEAYDATTATDPLLQGETWRIVHVDPSGETLASERAKFGAAATQLRVRSGEIVDAYVELRRITAIADGQPVG